MQPVHCRVKARQVIGVIIIFLIGVALVWIRIRAPFLPRILRTTFPHILGYTFLTISVISLIVMKSIRVGPNGIDVVYIFGVTRHFRFDEMAHVSAKMNMQQLGIISSLSGQKRHQVMLTPTQGRLRIIIPSSGVTNFMELYNVLLNIYREKMEVVDRQSAMF